MPFQQAVLIRQASRHRDPHSCAGILRALTVAHMKPSKTGRRTISLQRETIRILSDAKLSRVVGGIGVVIGPVVVPAPPVEEASDSAGDSLVPTVSIRVRCN